MTKFDTELSFLKSLHEIIQKRIAILEAQEPEVSPSSIPRASNKIGSKKGKNASNSKDQMLIKAREQYFRT